jgi:xanthine dehydrogenase YagR molybdenum-binding subunit
MKFDTPATVNPIDQLKVVGKPTDRIDGKFKTTGTAPYAYERHDVVANQAYGFIVGSAIRRADRFDGSRRGQGISGRPSDRYGSICRGSAEAA